MTNPGWPRFHSAQLASFQLALTSSAHRNSVDPPPVAAVGQLDDVLGEDDV
jgi:hypothetical protein